MSLNWSSRHAMRTCDGVIEGTGNRERKCVQKRLVSVILFPTRLFPDHAHNLQAEDADKKVDLLLP